MGGSTVHQCKNDQFNNNFAPLLQILPQNLQWRCKRVNEPLGRPNLNRPRTMRVVGVCRHGGRRETKFRAVQTTHPLAPALRML